MTTVYLRFADRAEACTVLAGALGYDPTQDDLGRQVWSAGTWEGQLYHVCWLADHGAYVSTAGDHVNLLWPGTPPATVAEALAPYTLPEPDTPEVGF